jgi:imidazolonepropionase-like amidohydrolase
MDNHEINKKYIGTYLKNLKLMNDSGVPLLVSGGDGAYIVPGFSMLEELRIFVDAGLTPYQALKAATSNAADYFGEKDQWGVLKPKTRADIVLLSENPLENIENMKKIEGVMVRGKWISKSEIDQRLKEIEEKYKRNE